MDKVLQGGNPVEYYCSMQSYLVELSKWIICTRQFLEGLSDCLDKKNQKQWIDLLWGLIKLIRRKPNYDLKGIQDELKNLLRDEKLKDEKFNLLVSSLKNYQLCVEKVILIHNDQIALACTTIPILNSTLYRNLKTKEYISSLEKSDHSKPKLRSKVSTHISSQENDFDNGTLDIDEIVETPLNVLTPTKPLKKIVINPSLFSITELRCRVRGFY